MIEVIITDTDGTLFQDIQYSKNLLQTDGRVRQDFMIEVQRMVGQVLQKLKEQWKEENK